MTADSLNSIKEKGMHGRNIMQQKENVTLKDTRE